MHDWENVKRQVNDLIEFAKEIKEGDEEEMNFCQQGFEECKKKINNFEILSYFKGKDDEKDVIFSITAGAGGTDAQDWAGMLLRMYLRYFEKKGFKTKILSESCGLEAGIKSVVMEVGGTRVYGNLKSEAGVHRLVRLSPFNSDNLRQTSFAAVEVIPKIEDLKIEIKDSDLKIETFRSSGAGGQHVNTTDSAVRVKHLPTGITTTCQSERSQIQNKLQAIEILKSKIFQLKEEKKRSEKKELKESQKSIQWGSQIRSYILHPYKMAKDHRTDHQQANVEEVLDGNLENFIKEYLIKISNNF